MYFIVKMAGIEMDVDSILGTNTINNEENLNASLKEGENGQQKISTKNKKPINSLSELIQKESENTREVIKKSHDHIREALSAQNKAIVEEILHEINPRFVEIENSLTEIKNAVRALANNESETESENDSVNNEELEDEVQENQQQNEREDIQENRQEAGERENRQENRLEARGGGNNRRRSRGGQGARNARLFFLLRQLERERGFGNNDRFDPYRHGRGGYGGGNRGQRNYYRDRY